MSQDNGPYKINVTFGKQGGLLAGILMGIRMAQHEIKRGIEQKIMKNALKL